MRPPRSRSAVAPPPGERVCFVGVKQLLETIVRTVERARPSRSVRTQSLQIDFRVLRRIAGAEEKYLVCKEFGADMGARYELAVVRGAVFGTSPQMAGTSPRGGKKTRRPQKFADAFGDTGAEARALKGISHAFVAPLAYALRYSTGITLLLCEYSERTLRMELDRRRTLPQGVARLACAELACAVAALHAAGIAHRAVRPDAVLVDAQGHLRLADYASALALASAKSADELPLHLGGADAQRRAEYHAPEQLSRGAALGVGVDYWALGCVLFELSVGETPFAAQEPRRLFENILRVQPACGRAGPASAGALCGALLRKDPAKRASFATVREARYFKRLDWAKLEAREYPSPFGPPPARAPENDDRGDVCDDARDGTAAAEADASFVARVERPTYQATRRIVPTPSPPLDDDDAPDAPTNQAVTQRRPRPPLRQLFPSENTPLRPETDDDKATASRDSKESVIVCDPLALSRVTTRRRK